MKAYILRKKDQPTYTQENYIIMAEGKRAMKKIAEGVPTIGDLKGFDIEEISKPSLVYTDLY